MKHITVEQLLARKQELVAERDDKMRILAVGYDNAIATIDDLINRAMASSDAVSVGMPKEE